MLQLQDAVEKKLFEQLASLQRAAEGGEAQT